MFAQQDRQVQYKPYIDLLPMHFGILVGLHMQDIEFDQTGPFQMADDEGVMQSQYILCDADRWQQASLLVCWVSCASLTISRCV